VDSSQWCAVLTLLGIIYDGCSSVPPFEELTGINEKTLTGYALMT